MWRRRRVVQTLRDPSEPFDPRVDAVELRLDFCPEADVGRFAATCGKPVVATVRRARDGGRWDAGE